MPRVVFTDEEYTELVKFAQSRNLNPKQAILAFVRLGNRSSSAHSTFSEPELPSTSKPESPAPRSESEP